MPTIKDIADITGLSVSTVSVVLRGDTGRFGIREETARKVRRTADRIGYLRNDFARTMVKGTSRVLGFLAPAGNNPEYSGRLLCGAQLGASEKEYALRFFLYDDSGARSLVPILRAARIGGVLISGDLGRARADCICRLCRDAGILCATVNLSNRVEGVGVVSDDEEGMAEMVRTLFRMGHRRIYMFGTASSAEYAKARLAGYRRGMNGCGLRGASCRLPKNVGLPALDELIRRGFTAAVCDSDYTAARLLQQAYECGIRIPDELSLCGFAGLQIADFAAAPISTVAQDFEAMGRRAAQELIALLERRERANLSNETKNIRVSARIRIQETTKERRSLDHHA